MVNVLIPMLIPSFHLKDSSGGWWVVVCDVCGVCGVCAVCSGVRFAVKRFES